MDAISRINEINELLRNIRFCLPIRNIEKISDIGYSNFGIHVNADNREVIKALSKEANLEEWAQTDYRAHKLIKDALGLAIHSVTEKGIVSTMENLNDEVGFTIAQILLSKRHIKNPRIFDMGTGLGDTVLATIRCITKVFGHVEAQDFLARCTFVINDVANTQLEKTAQMLSLEHCLDIEKSCGWGSEVLSGFSDSFDIICSNANQHHESFPDSYEHMRKALKDDGALVIGDFHTRMYDHPARLAALLVALGADRSGVSEFRKYFRLPKDEHFRLNKHLRPSERIALSQTITYIFAISNLIQERKIEGITYNPIEATRSSAQMRRDMCAAGFEVDFSKIRKAFPKSFKNRRRRRAIRLITLPESDVAKVTVGMKKQKNRI